MEYNRHYLKLYLSAKEETRQASKKHWLKIYETNFKNGIIDSLSASVLATIALAEKILEEGYTA